MKKMSGKINGTMKKGLSAVLVSALVCTSLGIQVQAQEEAAPVLAGGALIPVADRSLLKKPAGIELSDQDKEQLSKEETVYVIANADGTPQKLIVSDWLKNAAGMGTVEDTTELTGISTVKGDGNFQKKDGNLGVWDADGNDIYYQGSIQKALPVDMKVTYQLEGKTVSPEELAGQSGKVTIRFDYENKQKEKVLVGEQEEELYVPFVVLTGLVLDNDHFRNVEVSGGRVINDGERTLVMGFCLPGLKDNLDTGSPDFDIEELDLADYVELTADVTDFELATTLTVATNEIFSDMDVDMQDKMDDLSGDMDELQDAMVQLMDGTSELYDGVLELKDGADDLDEGAGKLDDGAGKLKDGTGSLKSGAGDLADGVNTLVAGLGELTAQNGKLTAAAKALFESSLAQANQSASVKQILAALKGAGMIQEDKLTVSNYGQFSKMLQPMIQQMQQGQGISLAVLEEEEVPEETKEQEDTETSEEDMETGDQEEAEDSGGETEAEEETDGTGNIQGEDTETKEIGSENSGSENAGTEVIGTENTEAESAEAETALTEEPKVLERENLLVQASPQEQLMQMIMGLMASDPTLKPLIVSVETHYQLYQGILQYTAGTAKAYDGSKALLDGAKKLKAGASDLQDGAGELKDGTAELKDGTLKLLDGVTELRDGSLELKDGTVEFNDEGIQKLTDILNDAVRKLMTEKGQCFLTLLCDLVAGTVPHRFQPDQVGFLQLGQCLLKRKIIGIFF